MKITALAPWFGGKRTMAPIIIQELGPHAAYWEPFCGSMAVLFGKEPATMETVNDLHGDLVNLARVVQSDELAPALFSRLVRTACAEPVHRLAAERYRARGYVPSGEPDVDRAADYFLCSWLGRNGVAGTSSYNQGFCRRFTKNGGHAAKRFASAVDSIPDWWDRLRHVTILNDDAFDLLPRIEDADGIVIYADPPYLVKGAKYIYDFKDACHERLAAELARFSKTRVIVSYYDDPRLQALYPGWTMVAVEATKSLVNQGMRDKGGAVKAPEVLLINGESYSTQKELF
jgi:DNA adenine methylase